MAIRLRKLYRQAKPQYDMRLVTGKAGLDNLINWVHMIEEEPVAEFLRGNELVFTTGIGYADSTWLNSFTQKLINNKAGGLIVNVGPYIKSIPEATKEYCRQQGFPLFTIPWHFRLVDVTRDFCRSIIDSEQTEMSISGALKTLIFFPADLPKCQSILECYGFDAAWRCCAAVISLAAGEEELHDEYLAAVRLYVERIINSVSEKYSIFVQDKRLVVVLANFSENEINYCIDRIIESYLGAERKYRIHIGVGQNEHGLPLLGKSYKQAIAVLPVAVKNNHYKVYYKDMGIYKILLSTDEKDVLTEIYNEVLGKLATYDAVNNTDYMSTLKHYLENDASVQAVAKELYLHRNTINYKLGKIKEITGCNLASTEDRLKIMLAFKIKDIL